MAAKSGSIARVASAALALIGLAAFFPGPAAAKIGACSAGVMGKVCSCDFTKLRPLQGAVGMNEVAYKASQISQNPDKERKKLKKDPIKVVAGPGGQLFITDHHHGAEAWLRAKTKYGATGFCEVVNVQKNLPSSFQSDDQFWTALKDARLVRFKDKNGKDITALPESLYAMGDDPYRSLAWLVRAKGGYCKNPIEFAEFQWADWYRSKGLDVTNLPSNPKKQNETVSKAVDLAHTAEAKDRGLPGYSAGACGM